MYNFIFNLKQISGIFKAEFRPPNVGKNIHVFGLCSAVANISSGTSIFDGRQYLHALQHRVIDPQRSLGVSHICP